MSGWGRVEVEGSVVVVVMFMVMVIGSLFGLGMEGWVPCRP